MISVLESTTSHDAGVKVARLNGQRDLRHGLLVGAEHAAHLVQFYEDEKFLSDTVCEYAAAGIALGQPVIIIATEQHRVAFLKRLQENALDIDHAQAVGLLSVLDAEETLALFMRDASPDWNNFNKHVGGLVRRARERRGDRPVRAYGEMVDLLWKAGNRQAAIRLEELWNELAQVEQFSLVCGYSINNFRDAADAAEFQAVCDVHSHCFPTETFSTLDREDARLREVSALQQRALAMEAELVHRRELEQALREREADLQDFLDSAVEGIHLVGPDGTILYANKAELDLLGYSVEEYVGRKITEFHVDPEVIQDILKRLCSAEALTNCEARLRCKDGGIKHVLINSNVRFREGKFIHTRCFTRDITERKQWEDLLRQAEERFRRMQEATPDGVAITLPVRDAAGKITDFRYVCINPATASALGRTADDILGRTLLELVPGLDETPFWQVFCRVADSGNAEVYEQPYHQNGWTGWYRSVVVSLGEELAVAYSDVTAQKKAEGSLRFLAEASSILASSLDYDTTLASVAKLAVPTIADWSAIDIVSADGSLKRLAVAHSEPEKVALAHELYQRFPPNMEAATGVAHVLRTGKAELIAEITDELLQTAVKERELLDVIRGLALRSSICVPLRARGRVVGAMTLVLAESGRRYTEDDLRLAEDLARRASVAIDNAMLYQAADQANQAKDEFLAVVSHELRTPLNAILGWVHMLREGLAGDKQARAIETIERNARAQNQLVEDLLDVSRIVSGKLRLDVESVDLPLTIERALETVRPAAAAKNITIRPVLDPKASPVFGDPNRLQQVVWNLLNNAVKFSPKDREVHVILRKLESSVEIIVRDEGQGIDPEFLPHVFERFRQADASTSRTKGGLGLGLAIVRNLVELHGGSVRAESEGIGRGATFCVSLPISPLRTPSFARPPALQLTAMGPKVHCPPELEGIHALVVDDEKDARDLLAELLLRCKVTVSTAGSVEEALRLLEVERPTVIISDIGMPEEDGYSLIRKIRALSPAKGGNTPAVALTAYARTEERTQSLVAGFNMHVPKPVEPTELLAVLASLTAVLRT